MQPAPGPIRDLLQVVEHALAGERHPALLGRGGPQEEARGGLHTEQGDVTAVLGHQVLVLLRGLVLGGLLERRERQAYVHVVAVAVGVPLGEHRVVHVRLGEPDRLVIDLRGAVEEVLEVGVGSADVVHGLCATVLQFLRERSPVGLPQDCVRLRAVEELADLECRILLHLLLQGLLQLHGR